ncbi:hypothetical protein [Paraburkholderia sp. JHI869]|uniref:hypothetical protein n=1 Tax=Paraburkholderia sp. JHI869 TaxID=3112959 RepID=UPI00317E9BDD
MLRLLQGLSWDDAQSPEKARGIFSEVSVQDVQAVGGCFEQLVEEGWICEGWHRVTVSRDVARAAEDAFPPSSVFREWIKRRYLVDWHWNACAADDSEVIALAQKVLSGETVPANIACRSPEWVSARLWDRKHAGPIDASKRIYWWLQRWITLGYPEVLNDAWSSSDKEAFQAAILSVTRDEAPAHKWDKYRTLLLQQTARALNRDPADFKAYIDEVPPTLVARAEWQASNRIERAKYAIGEATHFSQALVRILCRSVEQEDSGPAPHPAFATLVDFGLSHPEILSTIATECHDHPRLLADLLMCPPSSPLACKIITNWRHPHDPWERDLFDKELSRSTREAFEDAIELMAHWLERGDLPPQEAASIYWWLYQRQDGGNVTGFVANARFREILQNRLLKLPEHVKVSIAVALVEAAVGQSVESAHFVAALDFLDAFKVECDRPEVLTLAYLLSIQGNSSRPAVSGISYGAAAVLCRLASKTDSYALFLNPFDLRRRQRETEAEQSNDAMVTDELSRAVRTHIRILSRAIAGFKEPVPSEIVTALANAIRLGALEHREKGKVPAFAPRFEARNSWTTREGAIASDVGAALSRLEGASLESVLVHILESDEPGFLAQLSTLSPPILRARFEHRINLLVPEEAAALWSIVDLQARIEHLLNAGFPDAASRYMAIEKSASTLGPTRGREALRLQFELHLAFMREEWDVIDSAVSLNEFDPMERDGVRDSVSFYLALSHIRRKDGDAERAVTLLDSLHHRHPKVQSYATNLFAARLSRVMAGDAFTILSGAKLEEGVSLLAQCEALLDATLSGADADSVRSNKALLLLAVGRPDDAHVLLDSTSSGRATAQIAAYDAVALSRVGRQADALERLARAMTDFGATPLLTAVQQLVEDAVGPRQRTAIGVTVTDGSIAEAQLAADITQATFSWDASPNKFHSLMVTSVSAASASLISVMPAAKLNAANLDENSLSTLLREFLSIGLHKVGWAVPDQSLGGQTDRGNPGERDLVIKHGNVELSLIEAVICRGEARLASNQRELVSHLNKIFSYGVCRIFFHLTYCFDSTVADTIEVLKDIAVNEVFEGASFMKIDDMPSFTSSPDGFAAHYVLDKQTVTVVFLALNLGQRTQRDAAIAAKESKKRAGGKPAKKSTKRGARTSGAPSTT